MSINLLVKNKRFEWFQKTWKKVYSSEYDFRNYILHQIESNGLNQNQINSLFKSLLQFLCYFKWSQFMLCNTMTENSRRKSRICRIDWCGVNSIKDWRSVSCMEMMAFLLFTRCARYCLVVHFHGTAEQWLQKIYYEW